MTLPIRFAYTPIDLPITRATFPYRYYFRGRYDCDYPLVDQRRAGYCPRISLKPALPPITKDFRLPDSCFVYHDALIPCHRNLLGGHNQYDINLRRDPFNPDLLQLNFNEPATKELYDARIKARNDLLYPA